MLPQNLAQAIDFANLIANSGMVPKNYDKNPGAVLVAMQMGAEVGLSPMAAIQNIAVINGRPSMWGDAMLAVVRAHPQFVGIEESGFEEIKKSGRASCTVKRRDGGAITESTATFSVEDAETAGLLSKQGPWSQYPYRMLQMRARGFALRDSFPDALRGIHSAEESRDMILDVSEPLPAQGRHSLRPPQPVSDTPPQDTAPQPTPDDPPPVDPKEALSSDLAVRHAFARIKELQTKLAVELFTEGDDRKTIQEAAAKQIARLEQCAEAEQREDAGPVVIQRSTGDDAFPAEPIPPKAQEVMPWAKYEREPGEDG